MTKRTTRRRFGLGLVATSAILGVGGCLGRDDDHDHDGAYTLVLFDRNADESVADYHGHWHGALPSVAVGEHLSVGADFEDDDGDEVKLGEDAYQFDARVADDTGILETESHGDHVHLHGASPGTAAVTFQLRHDGDLEWETGEPIELDVVDE
ncbi:hypothetical protein OB955_09870 [Halobacteria archaeon AArc-m2/3/4]|uniref:Uncharacterized protein n=1 Tax=Natronoglomus mannanivorans TaxID=2979990 RepID=A0ABT2QDP6_9EURY|nr:hypothetical protein [Halobacteria archaeon AArc-m2/3/4]